MNRLKTLLPIFALLALLIASGCGGSGGGGGTTGSDPLPAGQKGKWTVLVYMNAANDLFSYSTMNMNQMETVATNPAVRYVVQWKQSQELFPGSTFDGTRRYLAYPDSTNTIKSHMISDLGDGVDMGLSATLADFVQWGKAQYPADHYLLIVWNHGNGWMRSLDSDAITRGVSYDDETGNAIQIWQLQSALAGEELDMIAFDASLMQMAEVAYELRNVTPLVVGSEESPPGEGYPYQLVLKPFADTPDQSPEELSKAFVDGMLNVPAYSTRKITQSVIDTSKLYALGTAAGNLANKLFLHPEANEDVVAARAAAQGYSVNSFRHYYDLYGFASELKNRVDAQELKDACDALMLAVDNAVLWEGHNAHSSGSHGIAIDLSTAAQYAPVKNDYIKLAWATGTAWDEWLQVAP